MGTLARMHQAVIGGRQKSARALAETVKRKIGLRGKLKRIAVLIDNKGNVYAARAAAVGVQKIMNQDPGYIVGIYNYKASADEIREDIEAFRGYK